MFISSYASFSLKVTVQVAISCSVCIESILSRDFLQLNLTHVGDH